MTKAQKEKAREKVGALLAEKLNPVGAENVLHGLWSDAGYNELQKAKRFLAGQIKVLDKAIGIIAPPKE